MTQTSNITSSSALPFAIPSGDDIYDALMADIEPDLLTVSITLLDAKYKDESAEERSARLARYEDAYTKYDMAFAVWTGQLKQLVTNYRRDALKSAESQSRTEESNVMNTLESQIVTA